MLVCIVCDRVGSICVCVYIIELDTLPRTKLVRIANVKAYGDLSACPFIKK